VLRLLKSLHKLRLARPIALRKIPFMWLSIVPSSYNIFIQIRLIGTSDQLRWYKQLLNLHYYRQFQNLTYLFNYNPHL
jgi:hypothetical protein